MLTRTALLFLVISGAACSTPAPEKHGAALFNGELRLSPGSPDFVIIRSVDSRDIENPIVVSWLGPPKPYDVEPHYWGRHLARIRISGSSQTITDSGPGFYALQPDRTAIRLDLRLEDIEHLRQAMSSHPRFAEDHLWQSVVIPQLKRIPPCGEPAPTSSELAGIWVAIGERHCLYQLTLKAEGSGTAKTICNLFGAPDTSEYQIREWTTRDYRFDVRLLPLAKAQDSLRFYGISCVDCLFLNHQIKTGEDHDSKLKFYRLSAVQNAVDGGM